MQMKWLVLISEQLNSTNAKSSAKDALMGTLCTMMVLLYEF